MQNNKELMDRIQELLKKFKITPEEGQTLIDLSKLSGDDLADIERRKLIADLVVAKKLGLLDSFMRTFSNK